MSRVRIGILSDTHGKMDRRVLDLFEGVDRILHAGDVGREEILIDLNALAPTVAILGNVDIGGEMRMLPEEETVSVEGVEIFLRHGHQHADPQKRIETVLNRSWNRHPRVAIVGHSHRPYLSEHDGILFMNPGSASQPRFGFPHSVGFLTVEGGTVHGDIVGLDGRPIEPGEKI